MRRERELTTEFLRLESLFLFGHHSCRVGRGNEKGHVETHVGYSRRNLPVPVPRFSSFAELNVYLAACCYTDLFRRVRGKPETKAERLLADQAVMLGMPAESFEARRVEQRGASSLSLVRFDRNDYSVLCSRTAPRPPMEMSVSNWLRYTPSASIASATVRPPAAIRSGWKLRATRPKAVTEAHSSPTSTLVPALASTVAARSVAPSRSRSATVRTYSSART